MYLKVLINKSCTKAFVKSIYSMLFCKDENNKDNDYAQKVVTHVSVINISAVIYTILPVIHAMSSQV